MPTEPARTLMQICCPMLSLSVLDSTIFTSHSACICGAGIEACHRGRKPARGRQRRSSRTCRVVMMPMKRCWMKCFA